MAGCSAVADVPGMAERPLATDYRGPLALAGLTRLRVLGTPFLPAVAEFAKPAELRELTVWGWRIRRADNLPRR